MPVTTQRGRGSRARHLLAVWVVLLALGGTAFAQWGRQRMPPKFPADEPDHRDFTFSRGLFRSDRREPGGQGWHTDYPTADQNLMVRLSELTTTRVGWDPRDSPDHVVVSLSDPKILDYPFLFMSDVGTLWLTDDEILRLRDRRFHPSSTGVGAAARHLSEASERTTFTSARSSTITGEFSC